MKNEVEDGGVEPVKLLLVDDRKENLEVLRHTLSSPGYELVMAQNGEEALRKALVDDFACIVLDVLLPGMDGFEIATLIKSRERSQHTPILFLTASAHDMRFIYRAYAVGGVDYMVKPIDPDVLRAKIAIFADLYRKDLRIRRQAEALREADRRQRERELAELRRTSDEHYRNLADAVPCIVWTTDEHGALTYVNRLWTDYTGVSARDTLGWNWIDVIHPDDISRFESGWRSAISNRAVYTAECRIRRASDGQFRWHLCYAVPEIDSERDLVGGWLATLTDTEDLRQAIMARDEFLAVASHELRTPLSTLAFVVRAAAAGPADRQDADRRAADRSAGEADRHPARRHPHHRPPHGARAGRLRPLAPRPRGDQPAARRGGAGRLLPRAARAVLGSQPLRSLPPRSGADQPHHQRGPARRRQADPGLGRGGRGHGSPLGDRQRRGHLGRGSAAAVRPLRARELDLGPERARARPLHQPAHRPGPRRRHRGGDRARPRRLVPGRDSAEGRPAHLTFSLPYI
jgi:PAS domain S-box-containing protein